jgi:hypothetical protein
LDLSAIDEAGLADPVGIELLEIAQRVVHGVQGRPAAPDTPIAVAGLRVELPELRAVRGQQDDRAGPREVRVEHLRLLRRVVRQVATVARQRAGVPGEPGGYPDPQQNHGTHQQPTAATVAWLLPLFDSPYLSALTRLR